MQPTVFIMALLVGVLVLCALVSVYDFKYRRIPNKFLLTAVVYFCCIFALMLVFVPFSYVGKGLLFSIGGAIICGLILYAPYKLKQVGAGDVKLIAVLGLFLGIKGGLLTILVGAMVGGVWALGLAYKHGGLGHLWYNLKFMARSAYLSGFKDMGWDLRTEGAIAMPYGVALSIGAALVAGEQLHLYIGRFMGVAG
ncbi:MAG: A24 family peptidase [Methylotenera sp.]|nr:A24 family peptidase [Methylotenera sp.]